MLVNSDGIDDRKALCTRSGECQCGVGPTHHRIRFTISCSMPVVILPIRHTGMFSRIRFSPQDRSRRHTPVRKSWSVGQRSTLRVAMARRYDRLGPGLHRVNTQAPLRATGDGA
jgi:hypothetical protein